MLRRALALILVLTIVSGCASSSQNKQDAGLTPAESAGAGVVIGAVVGGIIGAVVGGRGGAAIGAAAGAVLGGIGGYAWGEYRRRQVMSRDEAVQSVGYTPDQGHKLVIRETYAAPSPVKPGESLRLGCNYTVLAPDPNATFKLQEIREILYNDAVVFKASERQTPVKQGGEESDEEFRIPSNATPGQYTYRLTLVDPATNTREVKETTFTVVKA